MSKLLWQLEHDFRERLNECLSEVEYCDLSVKELLDLGFNNNYVYTDEGIKCLGFKDEFGNYLDSDFGSEVLDQHVEFCEIDEDGDLYTIIYVKFKKED